MEENSYESNNKNDDLPIFKDKMSNFTAYPENIRRTIKHALS